MKTPSRAIILLQYVDDPHELHFRTELTSYLEQSKGPDDTLMVMDNHSDAITTHGAIRLVEESDRIFVICEVMGPQTGLGPTLALLNRLLKKQNINIYSNHELPALMPFLKILNGALFSNFNEISI